MKVGSNYVVSVRNLGDSTLLVIGTDPSTNDGRGDDIALSGFETANGIGFVKSRAFFPNEVFDADWLIMPITSFDMDVSFELVGDDCLARGAASTFANTSTPVIGSRFYNFEAFLGAFTTQDDSTFLFDMGDGFSIYPTADTFDHVYVTTDSTEFTVAGRAAFFGMGDIFCADEQVNTYSYVALAGFSTTISNDTVFISNTSPDSVSYEYGDGTSGTDTSMSTTPGVHHHPDSLWLWRSTNSYQYDQHCGRFYR